MDDTIFVKRPEFSLALRSHEFTEALPWMFIQKWNAMKFNITVAKDETENYNAISQVVAITSNSKYHKLNSLNICNTQAQATQAKSLQ